MTNSGLLGTKERSCFARFKWLIIAMALVVIGAAVALGVVFGYVIPNNKNSSVNSTGDSSTSTSHSGFTPKDEVSKVVKMNIFTKPDLTQLPDDLGTFTNNKGQANDYSIPLNEPFPYGEKKIRGINLGGWLVPEPFIVPSLFTKHTDNSSVVDEWTLCENLGKKKSQEILSAHYEKFVSENDIKKIADSGLNHIRIPFAYWSIDNTDDEPFVYGAWKYLLRAIQWSRKYGLRVMIDFHAAPGSQNGWNHSGRSGPVRFLNSTSPENDANIERFMKILIDVAIYFNQPEWRSVVTQIGVLNEPYLTVTEQYDEVFNFYQNSYKEVRKATNDTSGENGPMLVYHDAFIGLRTWPDKLPKSTYKNVAIDAHDYIAFNPGMFAQPEEDVVAYPCNAWKKGFIESKKNFGLTVAAEFSVAVNDCGLYLNGMVNKARYDGTYPDSKPSCPTCSCKMFDDYKQYSDQHKKFIKRFLENQMDAFESGDGWYFWNFKTENGINPQWDYFLGLQEGWVPKDAGDRQSSCPSSE